MDVVVLTSVVDAVAVDVTEVVVVVEIVAVVSTVEMRDIVVEDVSVLDVVSVSVVVAVTSIVSVVEADTTSGTTDVDGMIVVVVVSTVDGTQSIPSKNASMTSLQLREILNLKIAARRRNPLYTHHSVCAKQTDESPLFPWRKIADRMLPSR